MTLYLETGHDMFNLKKHAKIFFKRHTYYRIFINMQTKYYENYKQFCGRHFSKCYVVWMSYDIFQKYEKMNRYY